MSGFLAGLGFELTTFRSLCFKTGKGSIVALVMLWKWTRRRFRWRWISRSWTLCFKDQKKKQGWNNCSRREFLLAYVRIFPDVCQMWRREATATDFTKRHQMKEMTQTVMFNYTCRLRGDPVFEKTRQVLVLSVHVSDLPSFDLRVKIWMMRYQLQYVSIEKKKKTSREK